MTKEMAVNAVSRDFILAQKWRKMQICTDIVKRHGS